MGIILSIYSLLSLYRIKSFLLGFAFFNLLTKTELFVRGIIPSIYLASCNLTHGMIGPFVNRYFKLAEIPLEFWILIASESSSGVYLIPKCCGASYGYTSLS